MPSSETQQVSETFHVDDPSRPKPVAKYLVLHKVLGKDSAERRKICFQLNRRNAEYQLQIDIVKTELGEGRKLIRKLLEMAVDIFDDDPEELAIIHQAQLFAERSPSDDTRETIDRLFREFNAKWSDEKTWRSSLAIPFDGD